MKNFGANRQLDPYAGASLYVLALPNALRAIASAVMAGGHPA
jgi:hypothetical protein